MNNKNVLVKSGFEQFKKMLTNYRLEKNAAKLKKRRKLSRNHKIGGFNELIGRVSDTFSELVGEKADLLKAYNHLNDQNKKIQEQKAQTEQGQKEKRHLQVIENLSDKQVEQLYDFLLRGSHVTLHLQEKYALQHGAAQHKGFEALVRPPKNIQDLKAVPFEPGSALYQGLESLLALGPEGFCRTAQHRGQGFALDIYVFEQSAQLYAQHAQGIKTKININILPSTFVNEDFAHVVQAYCAQMKIEPRSFGFEILESERISDLKSLKEGCLRLQSIGASVSIDDFCTGHAHPGYLYYLPVDEIKIPRDMLQLLDVPQQSKVADMWMKTIVRQAHKNGLNVVCEGVENEQQARYLEHIGVDSAQGFHFSKPKVASEQLQSLTARYGYLTAGHPEQRYNESSVLNEELIFHKKLSDRLVEHKKQKSKGTSVDNYETFNI